MLAIEEKLKSQSPRIHKSILSLAASCLSNRLSNASILRFAFWYELFLVCKLSTYLLLALQYQPQHLYFLMSNFNPLLYRHHFIMSSNFQHCPHLPCSLKKKILIIIRNLILKLTRIGCSIFT